MCPWASPNSDVCILAIKVLKMGLADAVVWNIGEAKSAEMKDLGAGEWRKYVCVEAAQIGSPVKVPSFHYLSSS